MGQEPDLFGTPVNDIIQLDPLEAKIIDDQTIHGRIIHIDRFGNCVTNLTNKTLAERGKSAAWRISLNGQEIDSFRSFFAEADEHEVFCTTGSAGFLEIGVRNASAAKLLNAQRGQTVVFAATLLTAVSPRVG